MKPNQHPKKIVIVGGVAGGATAAARVRRMDENAEITLLERGAYIAFANCGMPYFLAGEVPDVSRLLLTTPEHFSSEYKTSVRINTEATAIDRKSRKISFKSPEGEGELTYDTLILAQGGKAARPAGLPADAFSLRSFEDMLALKDEIQLRRPRRALVVGGGMIGIEMTETLRRLDLSVVLVETAPRLFPNLDPEISARVGRTLAEAGVELRTGAGIVSWEAKCAILATGEKIAYDLLIWSAGVLPEVELSRSAGLAIGSSGGVLVGDDLRTSDPAIFAIGDMIETVHRVSGKKVRMPLAGPANRQARIAASNAVGASMKYEGVLGSSVIRIFDHVLAQTGLSRAAAVDAGFDPAVLRVHSPNLPTYFPGSEPIHLILIYDRSTRRVLGAQAIGPAGTEKRIDVVATALLGKLTVDDLASLDLAYAPPFNTANDPLNTAVFSSQNDASGYAPLLDPSDLWEGTSDFVLDVRSEQEYNAGHVPGATLIPLPELRARLEEIPHHRRVAVYCGVGRRAHLATRILRENGIEASNVSGGWESLSNGVFQKTPRSSAHA